MATDGTQLRREYAYFQQKSEEVLAEYEQRAALPLPAITPPKPPTAYSIDAPNASNAGIDAETIADLYADAAAANSAADQGLSDSTGMRADALGMPGKPSADTSDTSSADTSEMPSTPTGALTTAPGLSTGSGVKPASLGGGGFGGGIPSIPLQPPVDSGSASRPGGMAPAGAGRGIPAGYAALGGGGAGMGPMGGAPGAQGQGAGKGKRVQSDEESLYIEDRPWTSSVIGNRRRSDAPDGEASKPVHIVSR